MWKILSFFCKKPESLLKGLSEIQTLEVERKKILNSPHCRRRKRKLAAIDKRLTELYYLKRSPSKIG